MPALDVHGSHPAEDRHAVIGLLAENRRMVAGLLDRLVGEGFVRGLQFLEAENVRLGLLEPSQQPLQPGSDRVDVPGGDLHGPILLWPSHGVTQDYPVLGRLDVATICKLPCSLNFPPSSDTVTSASHGIPDVTSGRIPIRR